MKRAVVWMQVLLCLLMLTWPASSFADTPATLSLSTSTAIVGEMVVASGSYDPDTFVTIKGIDGEGGIVLFDSVRSDDDGDYSYSFKVPNTEGELTIVAGAGENVASQILTVEPDLEVPVWTDGSLTASNITQTSITLNWSGASDNIAVTDYKIYKNTALLNTVSGSVYSYKVIGLTGGTEYNFQIQAMDVVGNTSTTGPSTSATTSLLGDTIPPVIVLNGDTTINLTLGDTYTEPGATATDDVDGLISQNIVIAGDTINTNQAGTYILTYDVEDEAGNPAAQVTRSVIVSPPAHYTVIPVVNASYTNGTTADGIITMTVKSGITGLTSFSVNIAPVSTHSGNEAVVFVQIRTNKQIGYTTAPADYDSQDSAAASFQVRAGDIIKVYVLNNLTNSPTINPVVFQ